MPHDPLQDPPLGDPARLLAPGGARRQPLRGFDDDMRDIVDYIVRITHRIWEGHDVGLIERWYHPDVVIHTSDGTVRGRDAVIAGSLATMAAFPDLRLYADDVIWSGDEERGFHTSHRIVWRGHHTGEGLYGAPTGRFVQRRGIAHCLVRENRIVEEWICRDELALLQQLGLDPLERARRAAPHPEPPAHPSAEELAAARARLDRDLDGPDDPDDPARSARRALQLLMGRRLLGRARAHVGDAFVAHVPPGRTLHGFGAYRAQLLGLLAALPDAGLTVDHQAVNGRPGRPQRVATRWRLHGTHLGPGPLGAPSGRRATLIGISHHDLEGGKIVRETSSYDLAALLRQLHGPRTPEEERP